MLPKAKRLTAAEVREVLRNGRSVRAGAVSARYTKSTGSKVAIVVSTKVAKGAVERNRLRRAGYRALSSLPRNTHLLVFIHSKEFDPQDVTSLCLKLS